MVVCYSSSTDEDKYFSLIRAYFTFHLYKRLTEFHMMHLERSFVHCLDPLWSSNQWHPGLPSHLKTEVSGCLQAMHSSLGEVTLGSLPLAHHLKACRRAPFGWHLCSKLTTLPFFFTVPASLEDLYKLLFLPPLPLSKFSTFFLKGKIKILRSDYYLPRRGCFLSFISHESGYDSNHYYLLSAY